MKLFFYLMMIVSVVFSKEYVVGFSQDTLANDWRLAQVKQVQEAVKEYPFLKLIIKDAKGKLSKQIRDIEEFIEDGVDFIITSPIDTKVTSLVLQKALSKGIKVILLSRTIHTSDYTVFIAPNNYQIGKQAGEFLAKRLNKKGTILMLQGIAGASSTIQREEGFLEAIKKYPQIEVIQQRANYLRSDAIKVMENLYAKEIPFDAIYSHSDSMLAGVREVMKRLKYNKNIPMVGIDYIKEAKEAIQQGEQLASFVYPTASKEGVKVIVDIIEGKKIAKDIVLESLLVTKENVDKVEPIF